MAPPLEILGSSHASEIPLFHFSPNPSFQTVVSFFTQSFVLDRCFIFHPIIWDRCFIFHPLIRFQTVVSCFTQSSVSRLLFHFSPKIWRRQDLNLQPPDLIHDELDHRTTVSWITAFFRSSKAPRTSLVQTGVQHTNGLTDYLCSSVFNYISFCFLIYFNIISSIILDIGIKSMQNNISIPITKFCTYLFG